MRTPGSAPAFLNGERHGASLCQSNISLRSEPVRTGRTATQGARGTPPGVRRDQLLRRARQIEAASRVQETSAELRLKIERYGGLIRSIGTKNNAKGRVQALIDEMEEELRNRKPSRNKKPAIADGAFGLEPLPVQRSRP